MSSFDPQTFLNVTVNEANTKRPPLPAGSDFVGVITDLKARQWQGKKDPSQSGFAVDVTIKVDLEGTPFKDTVGPSVTFTDGIMLDTTESGGINMGPGKNAKLRRYREALGMNNPGESFSFPMMVGRTIRVKVKHEEYEGDIYDRVDSVAKA